MNKKNAFTAVVQLPKNMVLEVENNDINALHVVSFSQGGNIKIRIKFGKITP